MTTTAFANAASALLETALISHAGAMAEYLERVSYRDPDSKGRMPWDLSLHYYINNEIQNCWNALYGNTTDTLGSADANVPTDRYWKPVNILARAEVAFETYLRPRPFLDEHHGDFDPNRAAEDFTFLALQERVDDARALVDVFYTKLEGLKEFYGALFDEAWVYKPFTVREGSVGTGGKSNLTPAQKAAQERYRAMAARRTGEAPAAEAAA